MTLTLRLRRSISELTRLSLGLLQFIGLQIYQYLQQRRLQPTLPAAPQPVPVKLTPTEIEILKVSEVAVSPVLLALVHQPLESAVIGAEPTLEQIGQAEVVLQDIQDTEQAEVQTLTSESVDRTTLVLQLLDEAHSRGFRTYAQLIDYVKQQTGEGCSKRVVANWKRSRGLLEKTA